MAGSHAQDLSSRLRIRLIRNLSAEELPLGTALQDAAIRKAKLLSSPMLRFTIKDVLWLTVVSAVLVAWWTDRSRLAERLRPWAEWERLMNEIS